MDSEIKINCATHGESDAAFVCQLVCISCYSGIRERNWIQDDSAFERLRATSSDYLDERQPSFRRDFRIQEFERYDYDQDTAQLVFSSAGKAGVICDVAFVGSISTKSGTWLWSWANESHLEGVKSRMREVRKYGEDHCFERLAGAYWPAGEVDGWKMTSIATYLLGGIGAYRAPSENGFLFMVVLKASWAQ